MWSPAFSFEFCLLLFIHHNNTSVYIVFRFGVWLESIIIYYYYHYYYYSIIIILSLLLRIKVRFTTSLGFTSINRFKENYCRVVYKPKLYYVEQTSTNNNIISRLTPPTSHLRYTHLSLISTNNIISCLTPPHISPYIYTHLIIPPHFTSPQTSSQTCYHGWWRTRRFTRWLWYQLIHFNLDRYDNETSSTRYVFL